MSVALVIDCDFMYDTIKSEVKSCDHSWKKDDKFCSECGVKTYFRINKEKIMKPEYEKYIHVDEGYFSSLRSYTFLGKPCDVLYKNSVYEYVVFRISSDRETLEEDGVFDEDGEIDFSELKAWFEDKKESLVDEGIPKDSMSIKLVDFYSNPI